MVIGLGGPSFLQVDWSPSAPRGFTQFPETASSGFLTLPCGLHSDGHLLHRYSKESSEASLLARQCLI